MIVSWPVLFIFLLQYTRNSLGTFLRVETGHQNIAIDGRDTYYGHYTKIHFHNVTCINSIDIHCLKELTGAEEIDLLYSECQKGHWKVAHYTNSKHHFRLKEPIHALRLLISSRKELSVIDAQVTSCTYPPAPPSECHRATRNHNHRHGKTGSILRAVDPYSRIEEEMEAEVEAGARALARGLNPDPETSRSRRVKRSIEDITMKETNNVRTLSGDQVITEDIVVPHRSQLDISPGSRLKFQKNVGLVIYGSLNLMGSSSQPVTMEAVNKNERWRGIEFRNASTSSLTHVNISGADVAVSVKGGASPDMDHVVADGNTYGIKISDMDPTTTTHLKSVVSVNNEKTGIEYLGKGSISIDRATAASNGGLGIFINTDQQINIRRSTAYSNNGTGIYVGTSEVTLENVVVNANGFYGIHVEVEKRLEMDGVNVSAHRTEFSVELFSTADAKIGIANSRFHDNKKGGVRISGQFQSPNIIFRDCRFLRNSGEIIQFNDFKNASLIMDKCEFVSSNYIDFDGGDSAVSLKNVTGNGNQLTISNCKFTKNTMHDVIKILETDSSATQIQISANEFNQNLANSIITTNSANASITENRFQDKRSTCEITYYSPAIPKPEDISDNKMRSGNKNPICTGYGYQTVQMDEPVTSTPLPSIGVTGNPFKTSNGIIKAASEPYLINEEVVINIGETVVIEPGTILDFAPGVGITVSGRLIMNGTEEKPIVTRGQNGNTWRGIVAKPEGVLDVKNVVSEDASIGIWIDSQKVKIENGRIVRPVVHGIEITQNSNDVVDLGGLIIEEASESAIGVDERRDDLLIKNTKIHNGVGSGIDFMTPTGNIELQNIIIDNMGAYGIHISEFPSSPLHAVLLENVSVTNQKRGHAGILISGGWIQNVGLHNLNCSNNYVPSLIVALECNDGNEKLIKMDNNSFERNSDIVQHIQLGSCANLQMERNNYNENNADGIGSTLVVTSESNVKKKNGVMEFVKNNFTNNGGIYTVTLDTNVHDAYFTDNFLTDNSNSGAVLKISGENVKIVTNNFDNKNSNYQIAYSDDSPIDATFNEWNGLDEETVLKTIDAKEGAVLIVPYGYTTVSVDNQLDPLTTVIPVTVPDSANIKCAHLAYCSRRGTCRDGICICPHGYTGFDCSIPLFCNCSGNGLCNLLNICMCNEGWSGSDCSTPKCVTNCTGHGKCSAPNKCECNQGWMGETCDITSCQDSNCVHGHCGSNGLCLCESGWQGSRCQIPYCANCSLNGVCIRPGFCSCFEDYGGSDCSKCVGDSCEACDFDCNHGVCEHLTKTCSCSRGWMGGACDVCASGKCDDTSKIQYIQPSTAELEDLNAVVNVFGDGFSITSNNSYVCTFGRTNVTGRRVSSSLIRCPIPSNLTLGRHVFSVSQPESFKVIGNSEARPIHFTLYDGCDISLCQGSCIGPLCICPQGKTGIFCDVIEVLPSIDKRFLEHQRANTAYEGVPYVLMLPTMASSVLRVNSTIPNLNFIASKGIVAWPEPIGSPYPYEVKVTAFSPAGQTEIAWNITVQPEYAVEVQNVTVDEGVARLRGKLIGPAAASMRKNPVVIRVRRDDTVDEILAESDVNGDVTFDYIPMLPGIYEVTIAHPNVPSDPIHPVRFMIPDMNLHLTGESSNSTLSLNITGPENCEVKVIQPKLENQKIERQGSQTIVDFRRFWDGEVLATVKCEDSPLEIVRAPPIQKNGVLTTTPEVLSVYGNENLYEVKVHWPPALEFSPNVVISEGSFDENPVVIPEDKFLRMTFSKVGESIGNGTIQVKDGPNLMSTIPYFYAASNKSQYYTYKICVRDEWDGQEGPLASTEAATIAIQNPQRGIDVTKTNVRLNVQWADFSLQPGTYSLLVRSELHEPVETIIELSPLNTSFCVPLVSSRSRNLPTIHCSHFTDPASCDVTITSVATSDNQLPVFNFQPSVVTTNGQKILVTPRGSLGGTIGLWNGEVSGIMVTPSKRSVSINESFWISFSWETNQVTKTCDVKNIQVPFVFLPESSQSQVPMHSSSSVLIRLRVDSNQICDSDNTAVIPATSTLVMCNCGDGARTRCRERYHSATACGGSWAKIADDTVSLEVLASFLAMVFECREVSVDFAELRNSLECVASIESDCPIGARRHKRDVVQMQNDSPFGIIHELNSNTDFGKVLPVLNALDVQTIRISSIFIEFVDRMQKMFPREVIEPLDRDAVDRFLRAIADSSDEGQFISEAERRIIGAEAFSLVQLWNLTVKSWNSGKIPQERVGITHQDAKLLVSAADRIKSISRQNVAQDPFAMLHGYMERMLETGETEQKECATSTVFIDKTEVEEDGQMRIQVFIKNKANITLTNVGVTLSFVKSESKTAAVNFNIGPSWSAGIGSLTGLGSFEAGSSFEIHWTRFIFAPRRLTTVAKYQPIIIFSFSSMGRLTQQKLFASEVSVIPKKTIRAINIIKDSLSPKEGTDFSVISAIINHGYTPLKEVEIKMNELKHSGSVTPRLDSVFVNGKLTFKTLTPKFSNIPSGSTQLIRILMKDSDNTIVPISSMNLTCLEKQKLLPLETTETYAIRAAGISDFGMLLATPNQSVPLFYFRPSAAQMVNVIKLEFLSIQKVNSSSPSMKSFVAAFRNPESTSFGGALWARMPVPEVHEMYKLVSIVDRGGTRPRELQAVQWMSEENGNQMLNWIDPGSLSPSQQMFYELQFSDPNASVEDENPSFEQLQYRIEIPQNHLEPNTKIGQIEADSSEDLTYFLYAPDNSKRFSVDSETGRIFYDSDEPLSNELEYCVVLEARDPQGRVTRVPVAINNGGQRRDCVLFSTVNLTPILHFGDYIPAPTILTPRTFVFTTTQPTSPMTTFSTTLIDFTPSPITESPSSSTVSETDGTTSNWQTTESWSTSGGSTSSDYHTSESYATTTDSSSWYSSSYATSEGTTSFTESSTWSSTNGVDDTTTEHPSTSGGDDSTSTGTTITFVDSTLETITPTEPSTTSESTTSGEKLTTPLMTTLESEATSPEYITSESTLQSITPPTEMIPTDFPTPSDQMTSTIEPSESTSTVDPLLETSAFPTPDFTLEPITTSTDSSTTDYPDGTTMTSPDVTLPILTTSTEDTWISTIGSSASTSEVTRILPTDPTTPSTPLASTTTESVYTVSSDGTLEPITSEPTTSSSETTTPPEYTISPDSSPETEGTVQPPIRISTVGGGDTYVTSSPAAGTTASFTVSTETPSNSIRDFDCASTSSPLTGFFKMVCDIQLMAKRTHRSQIS